MKNEISIIIDGVRYDAVETNLTGCKKNGCDLFRYCYKGYENPRVCKIASRNIIFKKSDKKFEK